MSDPQRVEEPAFTALLEGPVKDMGGGLVVRRLLPQVARRAVGPFVFFDHFGPATYPPGDGLAVRPHPHIGLATVTWLFEGAMAHRDSLGSFQVIEPGAVNWMTAGRGIVHSERSRPEDRATGGRMHGLQLWVALPQDHEEDEPSFHHHPAATIPGEAIGGARVRVMVGTAWGLTSPVRTASPTLYAEITLPAGARVPVPEGHEEVGLYVVEGAVTCGGRVEAHRLAVLAPGARAIEADGPARVVLIGGAPVGERHVFWNFVSSRRDRISQAADDWRHRRFPLVPGDEVEFIPLP